MLSLSHSRFFPHRRICNPFIQELIIRAYKMHNRTYYQRRNHGSFTYPIDSRHENQGQQASKDDQSHIKSQLHIAKLSTEPFRDDVHKIFPGHHGCICLYLQCDTYGQNHTTYQQGNNHIYISFRVQPEQHIVHTNINKRTETERNGNL